MRERRDQVERRLKLPYNSSGHPLDVIFGRVRCGCLTKERDEDRDEDSQMSARADRNTSTHVQVPRELSVLELRFRQNTN